MPDTDNGRVTLAVLSTKLDAIKERLDEHCDAQETKEVEQQKLENRVTRLEERQGILAGVNAAVSAGFALAAAWFGARK